MAIADILAGGVLNVADDLFALELWVHSEDPPYRLADKIPRWEGGVVGSASGETITFATIRQCCDPATRAAAYETYLTVSHAGRLLLVRTGALAGEIYTVSSNDFYEVTCEGADFGDLVAGDVIWMLDRIQVADARCDQGIDQLAASFRATVPDTEGRAMQALLREETWIFWRQQLASPTEATAWRDVGLFQLNSVPRQVQPSELNLSVAGHDALRLTTFQPIEESFAADAIKAHQRATSSSGSRCVVLKMVDESSDSGGDYDYNDQGFYRFFDSPESTEAGYLANHVIQWAVIPPPTIYASADTNDTLSDDDILIGVAAQQGTEILYGGGEVRIQARAYNEQYAHPEGGTARPYLKARYTRWANYADLVRGEATAVSTTTVTDSNLTGALALPTTGSGLADASLRFTSGLLRGQAFGIVSNTATAVTLEANVQTLGAVAGDTFELHDINDPRRIIEDLLAECDFQFREPLAALYVAPLDEILVGGEPTLVQHYDGSSYTDLTAAVTNELTSSSILAASGAILYVQHAYRVGRLGLKFAVPWTTGTVVKEYWNGSAWAALPSHGWIDTTAGLTQNGAMAWNQPRDWRPCAVNGSDLLFTVRLRCTASPAAAAQLSLLEILDRPSLPPPGEEGGIEVKITARQKAHEVIDAMRQTGVIPPNWILYVDPSGVVQGREFVQATTADYSLTTAALHSLSAEGDDEQVYTGVLYRGLSNSVENIAVKAASIAECDELLARIGTAPRDGTPPLPAGTSTANGNEGTVERATTNDFERSLPLVINGIDYREIDLIGNSQRRQRWQYICHYNASPSNPDYRELDDLPLWWVDLDQLYTDLSEVRLVLDGRVHGFDRSITRPEDRPILALEVTPDSGDYSGRTWWPLCNSAAAFTVPHDELREFRFSDGDGQWQETAKALRLRCVTGGWCESTGDNIVSESGAVVALKLYRTQEIRVEKWLGVDAPFTTPYYVNFRRRYRRRQYVTPAVDPSADTPERVERKAIKLLRELAILRPEYAVDACRPDAALGDTIAVTAADLGLTAELFFISAVARQTGGQTSATIQNFALVAP